MSKAIGITKEAVSKDWTGADKGFSFVDIQFVMSDEKEVVDVFLDKLDEFVDSCNKALDPTKELRAAAMMIAQINCDDEPIRPEVSN